MSYFSERYDIARMRFVASAKKSGCTLWHYPIAAKGHRDEPLSIDVCRMGSNKATKALVVSSGTHGVEGFFGSAVQLARFKESKPLPKDVALIMIHAINPYGFSHLRRVNEDNIDLNRNFMRIGERHEGARPGYETFNAMLNPQTTPGYFEFFHIRAMFNIVMHGLPNLKNAIAQGQYDYPKGIFFGGKQASQSQEILTEHFHTWMGKAEEIVHLDLHTGLGKKGTYVLGVGGELTPQQDAKWRSVFGKDHVQHLEPGGELYEIRGEFGAWCQSHFKDRSYASFLAEFGTYPILKVIKALCEENRATHWGKSGQTLNRYRLQLQEVFAPKSPSWREEVLQKGLVLIEQAVNGL